MKRVKKFLSLLLVLAMVFSLAPTSLAAGVSETETETVDETNSDEAIGYAVEATATARDTSGDGFYKIVHLDAARKYFTPDQIKGYIDEMADAGMNQLQIYFSDNQGFRLALDDMTVTTSYGTYDLASALGKGYEQTDKGMYPHDTDSYLTQSEMTGIISYAKSRGIEIVPCLNSPGHMGAILEVFPDFCYSNSNGTTASSIDLSNAEAVAFALAVVEKYVSYFQSQGVRFFNLGGDEYANDVDGMGFSGLVSTGLYDEFVAYLNDAAQIVINYGMTPRMFNDGAYYGGNTGDAYQLNDAIQICYWSQDGGASAATIKAQGHEMINTSKNLYYVVAESPWICVTEASAATFDKTVFSDGSTITDAVGAMMCVWCDDGRDETMTSDTILSNTAAIAKVYGSTLPSTLNTVTANSVSVVGNGLTEVTATATTVPEIESAVENKVVAYNVTPSTIWGEYTGKATVTVPVPSDWTSENIRGYVVNSDNTITDGIEGTHDTTANTFTFVVPHFSTVGAYELDDSAPVNGGTYTVSLGATVNIPLESTGDVQVEDSTYATAGTIETGSADYLLEEDIVSGEKYLLVNQGSILTSTSIQESSVNGLVCETGFSTTNQYSDNYFWTISKVEGGYTVQSYDGKYLQIASSDGNGNVNLVDAATTLSIEDLGNVFLISNSSTYFDRFNSSFAAGWGGSGTGESNSNERWTLYLQQDAYQLPVTGVAVGETVVWVGNTYYTIKVIEEDLTTVEDQTIYFQISTYPVWPIGASNTSVAVSAGDAYSEQGIAVTDLAPAQGAWAWASDDVPTVYWKTTLLEENEHQVGNLSVNQSMNGDDFTHIRYYGGNWQVLLSTDNTWRNVTDTDELVAYYLQQTKTTEEVTTYVQDWAFTPGDNETSNRYQKALSFAVVYPNGQMSPTETNIYGDSTLLYWDNLANLGFIRVGTNEVYEVSKLTYTLGARTDSDASGCWTANDSITWNKTTLDDGSEYYDETTVWTEDMGTEPVVDGKALEDEIYCGTGSSYASDGTLTNYDGSWGANDAVLILIYLKPVVTEESLTVQYWDDSTNSEIYNYPVNVGNVTDENPASFINRLVQTSAVNAGDIKLDDDAYIVNAKNIQENFEKDLTKISDLKGKYSSGLYEYVKAEISEDGKTLILHYKLNSEKLQPYYIADFGLSVEIPYDDLGSGVASVTASVPVNANGTVSVDSENRIIKFVPNKAFNGVTVLSVTATFDNNESAMYNVGVYPATTVYYEETFATLSGFTSDGVEALNEKQQSIPHGTGHENAHSDAYNFGYDGVYFDDATGASNATQVTSSVAGDTATFEFTGTGIEIYTNNTPDTGNLLARVYALDSNGTATLKKSFIVETAMKNGDGSYFTSEQAVTAYNVPVVNAQNLTYGNYRVVVQNLKKSATEGAGTINIDGFRVYGTLDYNSAIYQTDLEDNPVFIELRNKVLAGLEVDTSNSIYAEDIAEESLAQVYATAESTEGAVVLSSYTGDLGTADSTVVQDLLDNGPKNELYLRKGDAVVFKVTTNRLMQLGLKALNASTNYTVAAEYTDADGEKTLGGTNDLSASTDMFYPLNNPRGTEYTYTVSITNNGTGILSITDLKICDDPNVTFEELTEEDLVSALMTLGFEAENEPEYADATLNIALNDASGNSLATTALTVNGIVGETNTFSATAIEEAVATLVPEGYEIKDATYTNQEVAYGEEATVTFTAEEIVEEEPETSVIETVISALKNIFSKLFGWS